jgi:hypothetical protein
MIDYQYNYESVEIVEGVEGKKCVIFQKLLLIFRRI